MPNGVPDSPHPYMVHWMPFVQNMKIQVSKRRRLGGGPFRSCVKCSTLSWSAERQRSTMLVLKSQEVKYGVCKQPSPIQEVGNLLRSLTIVYSQIAKAHVRTRARTKCMYCSSYATEILNHLSGYTSMMKLGYVLDSSLFGCLGNLVLYRLEPKIIAPSRYNLKVPQ